MSVAGTVFQACSIDHSEISPLESTAREQARSDHRRNVLQILRFRSSDLMGADSRILMRELATPTLTGELMFTKILVVYSTVLTTLLAAFTLAGSAASKKSSTV